MVNKFIIIFFLIANVLNMHLDAGINKQKAMSILKQMSSFVKDKPYFLTESSENYPNSFFATTLARFKTNSRFQESSTVQLSTEPFINQMYLQNLKKKNDKEKKNEAKDKKTFNNLFDIVTLAAASGALGAMAYDDLKDISIKEAIDVAHATLNIELFDQTKIPPEVEKAIVRIEQGSDKGSATIIKSSNSGNYYVLTAQHCVEYPRIKTYIKIGSTRIKVNPILCDELHDVAILMIKPDKIDGYIKNTGVDLPAISSDLLSNIIPSRNTAVLLAGYPGFLAKDQREPYKLLLAAKKEKKLSYCGGTGLKLVSHKIETILNGASGGPVITLVDGKPKIIGIAAAQSRKTKEIWSLKQNNVFSSGSGNLEDYFKKAEKMAQDKIIAE